MRTIAFFNNKGGVGKTSLVYHLAWMFSELGKRVLAVDLDPQSNLTSSFLDDDRVESLWSRPSGEDSILTAIQPIADHVGDVRAVNPIRIDAHLSLLAGDLGLGMFEDRVGEAWGRCLDDKASNAADAFRVMTAFHRVIRDCAQRGNADLALIDVGPSIGSLNRAALVAADFVVVPLGPDLFSLQGLRNLGPTLRDWRGGWAKRRADGKVPPGLDMPTGSMSPLGYVLLNPSVRENRPVQSYARWADRVPAVYRECVLGDSGPPPGDDDPSRLAMIKHFKSLMPMAQDARKPMFRLTPAEGAIGSHAAAVQNCAAQFRKLAEEIMRRMDPAAP
ncbi:MAG: ParA family protein [Phycisphaerales bacterium]|nr:ParA family protein [Phycisphaerales bacterium]